MCPSEILLIRKRLRLQSFFVFCSLFLLRLKPYKMLLWINQNSFFWIIICRRFFWNLQNSKIFDKPCCHFWYILYENLQPYVKILYTVVKTFFYLLPLASKCRTTSDTESRPKTLLFWVLRTNRQTKNVLCERYNMLKKHFLLKVIVYNFVFPCVCCLLTNVCSLSVLLLVCKHLRYRY